MANTIDNMASGIDWFKFDKSSGNVIDSKGSAVGTVTIDKTNISSIIGR
ncbi:hypothetical protein ACFVRU_29820 [Streptomyces sp. NPDC057927]